MSYRVPAMTSPEHFPYCFWHPEVPKEETIRQLLAQNSDNTLLRYQAGRACAVEGILACIMSISPSRSGYCRGGA
ncbi:hypothetical protein BDW75DRAFT_214873 [Aspergillus navahoensis]